MSNRSHYEQQTAADIATEILVDPQASIREQVLAKRIRGLGLNARLSSRHWINAREHDFD